MVSGSEKTKIRFGTSGWRGIISDDFTLENFSIVVQAIANYLKRAPSSLPLSPSPYPLPGGEGRVRGRGVGTRGIIVGYDTRFMSDRFARLAGNILKENNIPVFLTNRDTPTPVIAFHILRKHTLGAINITASHNPPQYNGVKFSTSYGGPAPSEVTMEIEEIIRNMRGQTRPAGAPVRSTGRGAPISSAGSGLAYETFNPLPVYIKHISNIVDLDIIKKARLKIVIDCMYGTSRGYLDYILQRAGIEPVVLHNTLNPNFGGSAPSPSKEHLAELKNILIKSRAHIGLATDADADRFGIIDRDGSFIETNEILSLVLEHLLRTRKHTGGIVRSMPTTHLLDAIAREFNREIYEVPVGFKYVGSALLEKNAIMGCEESGGMTISGHVPEKDGILACLLMAELAAYNKKSLKELIKGIGQRYGRFYNKRIDVKLAAEEKEPLLSKLKNNPLKEFSGIKISDYKILPEDNIKMEFIDGSWIIIRPSGTEPILRCYVETSSLKTFSVLGDGLKKWFRE